MKRMRYICVALAILGILGGAFGKRYLQPPQTTEEVQETTSPSTLATDAFSIKYFQHCLSEKPAGNTLVAPHAVSDLLLSLQEIAAGQTLTELQALQLVAGSRTRATEPARASLLAVDLDVPRLDSHAGVMPLPFAENMPMALSLYNGMLSSAIGSASGQLANSNMVTSRTKLMAGCAVAMQPDWELPFNTANSLTADFDSASGGMPHFRQMRNRGLYRVISAEDDSWKALAIPLRKEAVSGAPLFYIAILPNSSARDFAMQLTPEKITDIRKKLADATPRDMLAEIPRMELQILPFDMRDTLRRIGLKSLFNAETADFSKLTEEKIHLSAVAHACTIKLVESTVQPIADASLENAPERFTLSRPHIWIIADMETDTPIEFMCLVEEMLNS